MNARALIIAGAVSAFFPGQVWAIGCVIEPSPVDCTIGRGSRYISPPAPVYSPPAPVYSPPPVYRPPVYDPRDLPFYPKEYDTRGRGQTRCVARDLGDGRGYVLTCQ